MINKVILEGRLAKDPKLIFLPSGRAVAEIRIANTKSYRREEGWKEKTNFIDIKAYGKVAEAIAERLNKGDRVIVEGEIVQETWEKEGKKRSRLRIVAENFRVLKRAKVKEED